MTWDQFLTILFYLGPFVLVTFGCWVMWIVWHNYTRFRNISDHSQWVLLEVILPKEIFRSPRSMEVVVGALNQKYAGNWWEQISSGTLRTWFSLEMVSLEGHTHFYIRTLRIFKHLIESQIYGQYGDVEIREVPDYVPLIKFGREEAWQLWGAQEALTMPDPYPIRTYLDYGLDNESLKEETKTDPISPVIEYLSSLGPGEYAGIQIMVQAAKDRFHVPGFWRKKDSWKDEGNRLIKKLMDKKGEKPTKTKDGQVKIELGQLKLSPGEQDVVKAVERSISKTGFDRGIRLLYSAPKANFSLASTLALRNLFQQYNTLNLNGFKHEITTTTDSVFRNWLGLKKGWEKRAQTYMFDAYRLRSYFYPPYQYKPFVLNTEELATIFHFPGGVITTGGLPRIESKKAEAPPNLPTG